MAPESWYWSHDIRPDQVGSLLTPGMRLVRLSCYGDGAARRFAALVHQEPGLERTYRLDLEAAELPGGPVAITAGEGRFSVVVEAGAPTRVLVGLNEAEVLALQGVADLATYVVEGVRRYAVVLDGGAGRVQTARRLTELADPPVRLRAYTGGFAAVIAPGARTWWYVDLDADGVADRLEHHRAYPIDLDATRGERGVRFTVVMRR